MTDSETNEVLKKVKSEWKSGIRPADDDLRTLYFYDSGGLPSFDLFKKTMFGVLTTIYKNTHNRMSSSYPPGVP
jgi:hypothetical protein